MVGANCIAKFDTAGKPDQDFGTNGSAPLEIGAVNAYLPDGGWLVDLLRTPEGYVVVTNSTLLRFRFDGTRDSSWGGDGRIATVELIPNSNMTFGAVLAPDGSIFISGIQGAFGPIGETVAKITPSGETDPSFATNGVYRDHSPGFDFSQLAVDGYGRILVAGDKNYKAATVMRLTPTGTVDSSFGEGGASTSARVYPDGPCVRWCEIQLSKVAVAQDGAITLLGSIDLTSPKDGYSKTVWIKFGQDGDPVSTVSPNMPTSATAMAELSDGDLAVADGGGSRINLNGSGGFSDGSASARLVPQPSPIAFSSSSISFNPVTGHLLSAGTLGGATGETCGYGLPCWSYRGAVAKVDAETGKPISSFGVHGVASTSPNVCKFGVAAHTEPGALWKRCAIQPPLISAKARFSHGKSRRPSVRIEAAHSVLPLAPEFASQSLKIRLPDRLRFKRNLNRPAIRVTPVALSQGSVVTFRNGRELTVVFEPNGFPDDQYSEEDSTVLPLGVTIEVRRGALKAIPRPLRKRRMNFIVTGGFQANTDSSVPWWGASSSKLKVRAKPVGGSK